MQFQPAVLNAITTSAARYGVSPEAMQRIAWLESRGNPAARNPNSSAGGLFQFIDSTAQQYGLKNKFDVNASADAGARLARDNAAGLRKVLGREPTAGELYLAHQQGLGGARKLLANPGARAVDVVGADAVRLNGGNENMTAGEFAGLWMKKAGDVPASQPAPAGGPQMTGLLGSIQQMTPFQPPKDERKFTEKLRDSAADGSLWDALAVGFNTLRMDPDDGLAQAAQRRMAGRQQDARANATADWLRQNGREDLAAAIQAGADPSSAVQVMMQGSQQARERNATAEWMRANGREDLANAIEAGVIDGAAAFKAMQPEAQDQTAAMQNYQAMIDMGVPQDQAMERAFGGGGVNVTVNSGSEVGTIPQGYELFTDPETGDRSMRPVVGGPEDTSKADAKKEQNNSTATEVITSAAARAREAAAQREFGGFGQGVAAQLPWTDSAEVARQVEVLKSNAKVENLQAMRAASPTGGALGAVSDSENAMLAAKAGALDPSSPTFLRDLDDYERTLLRIVHGKDAGDAIFQQTRQMQDGPTDDDLLKKYGG